MKEYIKVGKIVNTHGIRGTVKVISLTDELERFDELDYVYTELDGTKRKIISVSYRKGMVFLNLEGINDMNFAEQLKDTYISIDENQLRKLPENTYYIFELEGLDVFSTDDVYIGKVKQVFETGANDVYEVINGKNTYYIPAIKDVVKEVSLEDKKIIINVIEGLLE